MTPIARIIDGVSDAPTLHATLAGSEFLGALTAGDVSGAARIAYGTLGPSLTQTQRTLDPLRQFTELDGFGEAHLSAFLQALRRTITAALDSLTAIDMVAYSAHHLRAAPYYRLGAPDATIARPLARNEIALRGAPQSLILYRRRLKDDCTRIAGVISYLIEGNEALDGSSAAARDFDERIAVCGSAFADFTCTLAIAIELLSA